MKSKIVVLISTLSLTSIAAELTIPNTFTAGTPAKAADVNANFNAVKAAVDDKETRVTSLETDNATNKTEISTLKTNVNANTSAITTLQSNMNGKQDRVSGTCAVGSAISAINTNGSVTCDNFVKSGKKVFSPSAFYSFRDSQLSSNQCLAVRGSSLYFEGTLTTTCYALTDVELPNNVQLTGLNCRIKDTGAIDSGANLRASLIRTSRSGSSTTIFLTATSSDSPDYQDLSDTTATASTDIFDSSNYFYRLELRYFPNATTHDNLWLGLHTLGCEIDYNVVP